MVTASVCAGPSGVRFVGSCTRPVLLLRPRRQRGYIRITSSSSFSVSSSPSSSSFSTSSSLSSSPGPVLRKPQDYRTNISSRTSVKSSSGRGTTIEQQSESINPLRSTLPAPFEPPEKPPSAGTKYYLALGRAYYAFYKTGIKNAWSNYKTVRERAKQQPALTKELNARNAGGAPAVSVLSMLKYLRASGESGEAGGVLYSKHSIRSALRKRDNILRGKTTDGSGLTRADFQLLIRVQHDKARIIPFLLVLCICGEFTPLVVASGLLDAPRTCLLPSQAQKALDRRVQAADKAEQFHDMHVSPTSGTQQKNALFGRIGVPRSPERFVQSVSSEDVLCTAATMLDYYGSRRRGVPVLREALPWNDFPPWSQRLRTIRMREALVWHLGYLALDDALIYRAGGAGAVWHMSADEVAFAVRERGGVRVGYGLDADHAETEQKKWLEKWVRASAEEWEKENIEEKEESI